MSEKKIDIIVEESKTIQLYFKNMLTPLCYEIITAKTLAEVHKLHTKNKEIDIDLVSLDTSV